MRTASSAAANSASCVAAQDASSLSASADSFMCHLALWEAPGAGADEPETVWGDKLRADEYPSA